MGTEIISARPLNVFLAQCPKCVRPWRHEDDEETAKRRVGNTIHGHCHDCLTEITYERVYGTVTTSPCDPRCMGAVGPNCECGCGGLNHGRVWTEHGEMLASELERYRERKAREEAERKAKAEAKAKKAKAEADQFYTANAEIIDWLTGTDWFSLDRPDGFLGDVREYYELHHKLSDNQIAALKRSKDRRERWERERIERQANAVEVPEGRQVVEGKIVGIYRVPDNFSYYRDEILKIVVDTGTYTVSGTAPTQLVLDIREAVLNENGRNYDWNPDHDLKGHKVRFNATLARGKEKGRGYFKRPMKAELLAA